MNGADKHKYSRELLVVKIGGHVLDEESALDRFLRQFAVLPQKKILVHGGGKLATQIAEKLGIPQQLVDGRRITDAETLKVVTMVYAGYINKQIVSRLQAYGCDALGLSGADGNLIQAHKRAESRVDYGFAGDIDQVRTDWLRILLDLGLTAVVAPITHDRQGQLLNTNADTVAQELARQLSSWYDVHLIYSFERSGVLLNVDDENTVIPRIQPEDYARLKAEKKIFSGMIPKLDNAFAALGKGVKKVTIGRAEQLAELINHSAGTTITNG